MKPEELQQIIDNFRNNVDELHIILRELQHALRDYQEVLNNVNANNDFKAIDKEWLKLESQLKELKASEADINLTEFLLKTGVNPEDMKINTNESFKDYTLRMKDKSDVLLQKINSPQGLKSEITQLNNTENNANTAHKPAATKRMR